jgi:hypothetical protein
MFFGASLLFAEKEVSYMKYNKVPQTNPRGKIK